MKKILIGLLSFTVALASISCSSDKDSDQDDGKPGGKSQVTLSVNTSEARGFNRMYDFLDYMGLDHSVVDKLPSAYRMRVRNMVYNEQGQLVHDKYTLYNSYNKLAADELELEHGQYQVVSIADVVMVNETGDINLCYWNVKDSVSIGTARIMSSGYNGGSRDVVSAAITDITVGDGVNSYTIVPKPLGSLILCLWRNIHDDSSIGEVCLMTKDWANSMRIASGKYVTGYTTSDYYRWVHAMISPADFPKSINVYGFAFSLEAVDLQFAYVCFDKSGDSWRMSEMIKNIPSGEFYVSLCDLSTVYESRPTCMFATAESILGSASGAPQLKSVRQRGVWGCANGGVDAWQADVSGNGTKSVAFRNMPRGSKR